MLYMNIKSNIFFKFCCFITLHVPGERFTYPTVLFSGEDAFSSVAVQVQVEVLSVDVGDIINGVSLMIAINWVFYIQNAIGIKFTMAIFERAIRAK